MKKEYWNCIKVSDIKEITLGGGSYKDDETHEYFSIIMKDGSKHTLHYISKDKISYVKKARKDIKQIFNEINNVPETYLLYTEIFARINGTSVQVGYEVRDILDEYQYLTLQEIEQLRKQFKLKDNGTRSLVYIQVFQIEGNKITKPIEKRWIDQLENLGYDINLLEYELKE